ncbi:peptidylprolyl isomerase [Candidatus Pelagibacter communis]|uniref:peptidylprolyl isomerase n=1 Tax=Pelagibacter ubique TaxID=198252 RepID=UPI0015CF0FCC|nr:peptidylprolyl isomerase [Candidatus Pelagibacter ubique]
MSYGKENRILFKINNEIITSVDILQEVKYLSIINKDFNKTEKNQAIEIAKNSLIREKVKRIELLKYHEVISIEEKIIEEIIVNYFSRLNINSLDQFEVYFNQKNIDTVLIKEKIAIEILWNQLIYRKFFEKVKIDENRIKVNLSKKENQKEFLLSEIVFAVDKNEKLEDKLNKIKKTINEKNFSQAALIHSISDSSKEGGKLGWIKETVLNKKIKKELNNIETGMFTNPILVPGGFLLLYIEDTKISKVPINKDNEIKKIINQQTNEQLNRYSNIYFKKVKKNILINEF